MVKEKDYTISGICVTNKSNNDSNYNLVCSRVKVVDYNLNENNTIISFFSVPSYLFLFLDLNRFY
jgi:hypothetical protein